MDPKEKQVILDRIMKNGGYVLPDSHGFLLDHDPEYLLHLREFYEFVMGRESALPKKMKEICVIVGLCVRQPANADNVYIKNHMRIALQAGATTAEIIDALECAVSPTGGPTLMVGVKCLKQVLEERGLWA